MEYPKYFRCNKCGSFITKITDSRQMNSMCTGSASYRSSGICGGSFSLEITEEEYNQQLKDWEEQRNNGKKDNSLS